MASIVTRLSTFPLFSKLPLELREQIWNETLPTGQNKPALYFFRRGGWKCQILPQDSAQQNFCRFEWDFTCLDDFEIQIPIAFVNHEARQVAIKWAQKSSLQMHLQDKGQGYPIHIRTVDPENDALYLGPNDAMDFLNEVVDFHFQPQFEGYHANYRGPLFKYIALPMALFQTDPGLILEILMYWIGNPKGFLIIKDWNPDIHEGPQWWQFDLYKEPFLWNDEKGAFDFDDSGQEYIGDNEFYKMIQVASRGIAGTLKSRFASGTFEIRPVHVVMRDE